MSKKFIDLLLVQDEEGSQYLVSAPSCTADVGCIVRFMGGATGTVIKKAWTASDGEVLDLISTMLPIFTAEAVFSPCWCKEDADAAS